MADDASQNSEEQPRIIVDEDWKTQAQREKEQLQAKMEAERQSAEQGEAGPGGRGKPGEIPPPSFSSLVSTLATQAVMSLQGIQVEGQQPMPPDLPTARYLIDTLIVLQQKTQGNLDEQEQQLIDGVIKELQLAFVEVSSQLQQLAREAVMKPPGGGPQMP